MENKFNAGLKYDDGKLRWDLLPIEAVEKVVEIMTYGCDKYGTNTWQNLNDFDNRYFAAAIRHLVAWRKGEAIDHESGMSHLAHAACNVLFLLWKETNNGKRSST